ncbi:MAG: cyclase family protein [Pyrinomonadaceae bacterium]
MNNSLQFNGKSYDLNDPIDISIPLRFNGPQPNAYGVERAASKPVEAGTLIGDTRRGGSVNFEQYAFIPHCSGTHTECVGHITHARISVRDCLPDVLMPARLVSVSPEKIDGESVLTRKVLESALSEPGAVATGFFERGDHKSIATDRALVIRTLPNDDSKLTREYGESYIPPYFAMDAMSYIVEIGIKHLLTDLPSIDRIFDDGKLLNHRLFWKVDEGGFETNAETRKTSTITELIYAPNEVPDGEYLLNLQIAPFESDCAPSRPILLAQTLSTIHL